MHKLTWAGLTDVGRKRTGNEDAYVVDPEAGLYVVCDGMGGHASGEVASAMTTEHVHEFMRARQNGDRSLPYEAEPNATMGEQVLSNAIQHANDKVYIAGMRDAKLEGMGTTVVAISEFDDALILAHVGDSRIYRLRDSHLSQVTRDHSLLNHKIDMGELRTQEEIDGFKHGNVIVRAIGLKDYVRPETAVHARVPGDLYLLCSDGLSDMVDDWSIENVLDASHDDLDGAVQILIRMANDRGGRDNITAVLVRVDDSPDAAYAPTAPLSDAKREESTRPGIPAVEDDEFENIREFRDFEEEDDDRTAPATPVFAWEEEEDTAEDAARDGAVFSWDDDDNPELPPPVPDPRPQVVPRQQPAPRPQPLGTRQRLQPTLEAPRVLRRDEDGES